MKNILVTGGAGYIGSHVVRMLAQSSYNPVIYDNLVTGYRELAQGHELIEGDIGDYDKLCSLFKNREISCVMNFASYIAVGESVQKPLEYYDNNVARTINLFRAMVDCGVMNFIFSSTAAVYGYPETMPIKEDSVLNPINPYGRTKYFIEKVLQDMERAYAFKSVCLRYFNAAGADPSGEIGEMHVPESHLIPLIMRSVLDDSYSIKIFGTDYETPDGTCIRDYVHVNDLAKAHVLAMEKLIKSGKSEIYNLGNGTGFSVKQVIESVQRITGKEPDTVEDLRRPGDPPVLVASSEHAVKELNWKREFVDIDSIVETAWKWESSGKRKGY